MPNQPKKEQSYKVKLGDDKEVAHSLFDDYSNVIDFNRLRATNDSDSSDPELVHDEESDLDPDLREADEAPSREKLETREEPDIGIQFPRMTETHPPGGIPSSCEGELWLPYIWYKKLRCLFLISRNKMVQSGVIRGYLGLYHERFLHLVSFPYVIHPYSDFFYGWQFLITILISLSLMYEPFMLAFRPLDYVQNPARAITLTTSLILLFDMLLTFDVGLTDNSTTKITLDPIIIRKRYLRWGFWFDLLTRFPYDSVMLCLMSEKELAEKPELTSLRIVSFFVKMFRVKKVYYYVYGLCNTLQMSTWSGQMITHGVLVGFCIHWGACLHWLGPDIANSTLKEPKPMSWVTSLGLWNRNPWFQYANAYLRSLSNLLTLDGGEFIPRELEEIFTTILLVLVAQSIFSYYVSTFSTMIMHFQMEDDRYREMIGCIEQYLRFRKIPAWLQDKVYAYYDKRYRNHSFPEAWILASMSANLRSEISGHNCKRLVESVYLFSDVPTTVMLNLVQRLEYDVSVPGDVMMSPNVHMDCMYFIEDGHFRVINELGKCMEVLAPGDFFGEVVLLCPDIPRTITVVSATFGEVYKLSRKNYIECMQQFPEVYMKIAQVATARISYELSQVEERVYASRDDKEWLEILKFGRKKIEEHYSELDSGALPPNYIPPEALQQIYLDYYASRNDKKPGTGERSSELPTRATVSAVESFLSTGKPVATQTLNVPPPPPPKQKGSK